MGNGIALLSRGFTNINLISSSEEVDFMIQGYKDFELFGQKLYFTTTHISIMIVSIVILIFAVFVNIKLRKAKEDDSPGVLQNIIELAVESIDGLVVSNMGRKHGLKYSNYIGALLIFIFMSNLSGLFGLRPPTADYGITLGIALITFVMIQFSAFKYKGFGHFTELFEPIPVFFPMNLIGEFTAPLTMSLRLFGNITAGMVMMALYYGMLPIFVKIGIPAALHVYFDLLSAVIQTFVFCMLTMVLVSGHFSEE